MILISGGPIVLKWPFSCRTLRLHPPIMIDQQFQHIIFQMHSERFFFFLLNTSEVHNPYDLHSPIMIEQREGGTAEMLGCFVGRRRIARLHCLRNACNGSWNEDFALSTGRWWVRARTISSRFDYSACYMEISPFKRLIKHMKNFALFR